MQGAGAGAGCRKCRVTLRVGLGARKKIAGETDRVGSVLFESISSILEAPDSQTVL